MSDIGNWADSQQEKLNRIHDLVNEIMDNHLKMQQLLSEAIIKCQTERGLRDIEDFLNPNDA